MRDDEIQISRSVDVVIDLNGFSIRRSNEYDLIRCNTSASQNVLQIKDSGIGGTIGGSITTNSMDLIIGEKDGVVKSSPIIEPTIYGYFEFYDGTIGYSTQLELF